MEIQGLHLLLTYQCTLECDHCFVWGSPQQSGVMTYDQIEIILGQAADLGNLEEIYFEGGEPFLYYPILKKASLTAAEMGFKVGIVSNAYWATSIDDAREWLLPFAGIVQDLAISSDLYHAAQPLSRQAENALQAALTLGIPAGLIEVAQPQTEAAAVIGQIPSGSAAAVMYRGRAAVQLAAGAIKHDWQTLDCCPNEDLTDSGRLHVDPFGYLHLCQGIVLGNLYVDTLRAILAGYDPKRHPIAGPLLAGGPAELVRHYEVPHDTVYADACHLCYTGRLALRQRFPNILTPDSMYGIH